MNAQNITEPRSDALQHNVSAFAASFSRTTLPGRIIFGNDALISLDEELDARKAHRTILIVSDRQGHLSRLGRSALGSRLRAEWNTVRQHVPRELAARATDAAGAAGADSILAIGGGSTIGLGKAVAVATGLPLAVSNDQNLWMSLGRAA